MGADPTADMPAIWDQSPGASPRLLHSTVDEELRHIFASARSADPGGERRADMATGLSARRVRSGVGPLGVVAGLVLMAVAAVSLMLPKAPPAASAAVPVPAEITPELMPDPVVLKPVAAPPRAVKRTASTTEGRRTARVSSQGGCGGLRGDALARCLWPSVMSADRDLRRAYERAVRVGVSRSTLVSYRDRWSSLRRDAQRDPRRTISAYRRMAGDLDRAQTGPGGG
jgi:hypothetical protein